MTQPRKPRASKLRARLIGSSQPTPSQFHNEVLVKLLNVFNVFIQRDQWDAIEELRELRKDIQDKPELARAFGLVPTKPGGRPKGSRSINLVQSLLSTMAIDWGGFKKCKVLRILRKKDIESGAYIERHHYRWLNERLKRGQKFFQDWSQGSISLSPDKPTPDKLKSLIQALEPHRRKEIFNNLLSLCED